MRWRDVLALAARGVARRPGRAVLTVLAVALAAALFSALVTISRTAQTRVLDQMADGGPLAGIEVAAAAPDPTQVEEDDADPGEDRDLDDATVAEIADLPDVTSVIPLVSTRVVVAAPDAASLDDGTTVTAEQGDGGPPGLLFETMVGADVASADDLPVSVIAGRLPQPASYVEVAVTPTFLDRFGLERDDADRILGLELEVGAPRSFGETIRARWTKVEVVGVAAQEATSGTLLAPIEAVQPAQDWSLAGVPDERLDLSSSPYSGAFVVAQGLDQVASVRNGIHDIGYSTSAPENLITSVQRYLRVVEIVLAGIGLIALAIAALGISNALLAAVRERRREIGVLKAIGARDRDILRLFLVEAGVLGVIGGFLGTLLGMALASAVGLVVNDYLHSQGLEGVRPEVPVTVAVAGVVGAGLLAVLAGWPPARRAARLPAREAVAT